MLCQFGTIEHSDLVTEREALIKSPQLLAPTVTTVGPRRPCRFEVERGMTIPNGSASLARTASMG